MFTLSCLFSFYLVSLFDVWSVAHLSLACRMEARAPPRFESILSPLLHLTIFDSQIFEVSFLSKILLGILFSSNLSANLSAL